jgi:hypothetical protein
MRSRVLGFRESFNLDRRLGRIRTLKPCRVTFAAWAYRRYNHRPRKA